MGNSSLLVFDGLTLHDGSGATGEDYWFSTQAQGARFGEAVPVEVFINSLIRDGALTRWDHDDNREMQFFVTVHSSDGAGLSLGVAALNKAARKPTTLAWTPADGFGPTTVWEVHTSSLHEPDGFDDLESLRAEATYRLRIIAAPYGRSVDKVTDDAEAADIASGTVYDDGTSTTNWAGSTAYGRTPAVVVDSGAVKVEWSSRSTASATTDGETYYVWQNLDTRSGLSIATGTGGYLSAVIKMEHLGDGAALGFGDTATSRVESITMTTSTGATIEAAFSAVEQLSDGRVRYAWSIAAGLTVTSILFNVRQYRIAFMASTGAHVWYDDLIFSDSTTTSNQYAKVVDIAGSARAPGAIHVAANVALGDVFLLSMPEDKIAAGFTPDIRRWRTSGGAPVTDATAMHGSYFTDPQTFEVPVTMLTEGAYSPVGLVRAGSDPATITVTAQLVIGGTLVGAAQTVTNTEPLGGRTGYFFMTAGELYLPPRPMQAPDATCKVRFTVTAQFAELWLAPTWGDLTLADLGTGTVSAAAASSHLWVDSPSADRPMGAWWRGSSADRALATSAASALVQPGRHLLYPPKTRVFVASSAAAGATVTVDYFPRWHGLAAS